MEREEGKRENGRLVHSGRMAGELRVWCALCLASSSTLLLPRVPWNRPSESWHDLSSMVMYFLNKTDGSCSFSHVLKKCASIIIRAKICF